MQLEAAIALIEQGQPQAAMGRVLLEMMEDEGAAVGSVRVLFDNTHMASRYPLATMRIVSCLHIDIFHIS